MSEVHSGVNHEHLCPKFHLLREGVSSVPRNLTQTWLLNKPRKADIQKRVLPPSPQGLSPTGGDTSSELCQGLEGSENSI